jgi:hypothetical protein
VRIFVLLIRCSCPHTKCSEINLWFGPEGPASEQTELLVRTVGEELQEGRCGLKVEETLAMIKPIASEMHAHEIISIIHAHGFEIVSEMRTTLSRQSTEVRGRFQSCHH